MKKFIVSVVMVMVLVIFPIYAMAQEHDTPCDTPSICINENENTNNNNNTNTNEPKAESASASESKAETASASSAKNEVVITNTTNIEDGERLNTQLDPMELVRLALANYNGPVYKDHKIQAGILDFILSGDDLKSFTVTKKGFFTRDWAPSTSDTFTSQNLPKQKDVFVFRNMAAFLKHFNKAHKVGYVDTFSEGDETLMHCFNQAVIDAGEQGANVLVLFYEEENFVAGMGSSAKGIGGSGASGIMSGSTIASVLGAAVGFNSSDTLPTTNPFIHGVTLHVESLDK